MPRALSRVQGLSVQRRLLALIFTFLLLAMQQEGARHELTHLSEALQHPHRRGIQVASVETACAECALLAGASGIAPTGSVTVFAPPLAHAAPRHAFASRTVAAPSYYSSQAPPARL
jgi:hypothetical protein